MKIRFRCEIPVYKKLSFTDSGDIDNIANAYFKGVKQSIFVSSEEAVFQIAQNIMNKFDAEGIFLKGRNFILNAQQKNELKLREGSIGFFNFEVFSITDLSSVIETNLVIKNGEFDDSQVEILDFIGDNSKFNIQQYKVEHAPVDKDIVVKAGAGTGKTYSMISRISYICHQASNANILDVKNEIAMLTFTTEAATNLKIALKLQNLLEQSGCTVLLTRSDENAIYDIDSKTLKQKKISDIHNRVKIGNESSADIFVSIHLNKIPEQAYIP